MANYKKILKKATSGDKEYSEIGTTVPGTGQVILEPGIYPTLAEEIDVTGDLATDIRSGLIVVNDGVNDIIDVERAIDYLKYPDTAFNSRFLSEPERSNGFNSKTIQEAIEEARQGTSVSGRTYQIELFNNGNTSNKWLYHIPTNEASDQLPYITAWNIEIFGIVFSNKNPNIDCDVEFYVNGTNSPAKVYTMEVRNFKNYWQTTDNSFFSLGVGDELSIFIRKVGQSSPSSVEVDLNIRVTNTTIGSGGSN